MIRAISLSVVLHMTILGLVSMTFQWSKPPVDLTEQTITIDLAVGTKPLRKGVQTEPKDKENDVAKEPEVQPEQNIPKPVKPEIKSISEIKQEREPVVKPVLKPVTPPAQKPEVKPVAKPAPVVPAESLPDKRPEPPKLPEKVPDNPEDNLPNLEEPVAVSDELDADRQENEPETTVEKDIAPKTISQAPSRRPLNNSTIKEDNDKPIVDAPKTDLVDQSEEVKPKTNLDIISQIESRLGQEDGESNELSISEVELVRNLILEQVRPCYNQVVQGNDRTPITLLMNLNQNGSLQGEPILMSEISKPEHFVQVEATIRAVHCATPLELPEEFYAAPNGWKQIEVNFDPVYFN